MPYAKPDMMSRAEIDHHLDTLGLSQGEAARLLSVNPRTVRRWVETPSEMPGAAEQALRAWRKLQQLGLAWRPDGLPIGENDTAGMAEQIGLYRQHAIDLEGLLRRVEERGGPAAPWEVDLVAQKAVLGSMVVTFYRLPNGGFSPATYRRTSGDPDAHRDAHLLEDAYACIAHELARRPAQ
jgi:hypothetical protein